MPLHAFLPGLPVHSSTLDNGLRLHVVRDPSAPVVACQTWFQVGSSDEELGHTGLAHLLEHLMFKATEDYEDGQFTALLDALGASGLNAWTWLDQTAYTEAVPVDALEEMLRLESSRMARLRLDEASFAAEREVVMNERRWAVEDDPSGKASEALFAAAFGREHPYGWPTIGWMDDIAALTLEDALAFYRRSYAPDQADLVLVGDVEADRARELVERHYGDHPASGRVRRPVPASTFQSGLRRVDLEAPLAADRILVGFDVPEHTHADLPALLVLDAALTAGMAARLPRALRDTGLVADLGAMIMPNRAPSLYQLSVRGRPGVCAERAEAALWAELERIRAEGLSEGELRQGIAAWRAITWQSLEDAAGKADFLGWSLTLGQAPDHGLRRLEEITGTTREDVLRVARRYLRPEGATVAVARAQERAPAVEVSLSAPVAAAPTVEVEARPRGEAATLPVGDLVEDRIGHTTVLRVLDPTLPLVHFRLWLPVGGLHDPPGAEGLAYLAGCLALRGTRRRARSDFESALEQLGASVQVIVDADDLLVAGTVLSDAWPRLVSLLVEALAEPACRPEDHARLVDEITDDLASLRDDDGDVAKVALVRALYGEDHPYGRDVRGTVSSVRSLGAERARDFLSTHVRASGGLLAVVGDLDDGVLADARVLVEALPGAPPPRRSLPAPRARRRVLVVDKPERTQVQVRVGHAGLDHRRADFPAMLLANDAFGVGFSGRLMKEVREKRGWSYFAWSTPTLHDQGGDWLAGLAPSDEQAPDAVALVVDLVRHAVADGFTDAELDQARSARVQGRPFLVDTARKRLDLELRRRTQGYDRLAVTDAMAGVDLDQANAAFASTIRPDALVVATVATARGFAARLAERLGVEVEVLSLEDLGL